MKNNFLIKCVGILFFPAMAYIVLGSCTAQKSTKYSNEAFIEQRADPQIVRGDDGTYYFIATVPQYDRIEIRKAKSIEGLRTAKPVEVWHKHDQGIMGAHIWAPELHQIDGVWYIYFAAGSAEDKWNIKKYALSNTSADPTSSSWKEEGEMVSQPNIFTLDATTFAHKGQRYMIWVDRASNVETNTGLFLAKMKSPIVLDTNQIVITQPEYDWERRGHNVNEGPAVLIRNGKIFVTFSASATDANYCMGLLWADEDADLMDVKSWHKLDQPVFYSNDSLKRFGPGHNSFVLSEDGKTDVMVYHARNYRDIEGEPLYDPNRHTYIRPVKWRKDGFPDFGQDYSNQDFARH